MAASLLTSLLAFLAISGGALGGVWLASRLPEPHLNGESRTAISVSMAVVGMMSALVLSLLISNASTAFNAQTAAVNDLAIDLVKLNHALIRMGDGTAEIRRALLVYATAKAEELSGHNSGSGLGVDTLRLLERVSDGIVELDPATARDTQVRQRALTLVDAITDARWSLAETAGSAIPHVFLGVLIFWLALLFASFGLFAPRNQTVLSSLLLCALAIAGGIFVILELGSPHSGLVKVSLTPMELAVQHIRNPG